MESMFCQGVYLTKHTFGSQVCERSELSRGASLAALRQFTFCIAVNRVGEFSRGVCSPLDIL